MQRETDHGFFLLPMYTTYILVLCNSRDACPASLFFCALQESLGLVQLESHDINLWRRIAIRGNETHHWGRNRSTARNISASSHSSFFLQPCAKERWHAFDIGFPQLRMICCGKIFSPSHGACTMRNSPYLCDFLPSGYSPLLKKKKKKNLPAAGPSYSRLKSGPWNSRLHEKCGRCFASFSILNESTCKIS